MNKGIKIFVTAVIAVYGVIFSLLFGSTILYVFLYFTILLLLNLKLLPDNI